MFVDTVQSEFDISTSLANKLYVWSKRSMRLDKLIMPRLHDLLKKSNNFKKNREKQYISIKKRVTDRDLLIRYLRATNRYGKIPEFLEFTNTSLKDILDIFLSIQFAQHMFLKSDLLSYDITIKNWRDFEKLIISNNTTNESLKYNAGAFSTDIKKK